MTSGGRGPGPGQGPGSPGKDTDEVVCVRFNQDAGCFVCGTTSGFIIYNADPLREKQRITWKDGGIGCAEMLFRCSHLALVGGGPVARYPRNKVVIWNGATQSELFEMEFKSAVKNVRLRKDRIVVILESLIKVFSFDLNPLEQERFETGFNIHGLCEVCAWESSPIVAYPGPEVGQLGVASLGSGMPPELIAAHENPIACIALSKKGDLVATASQKGTLVRVFNTHYKVKVDEFRRGSQPALIYSISFNHLSSLVCVSSDRGTLHVFNLTQTTPNPSAKSQRKNSAAKLINPNKSFIKIDLKSGMPCYCEFSTADNRSLVAVSLSGDYHKFLVEENGTWTREFTENLLSPRDVFTSFPLNS